VPIIDLESRRVVRARLGRVVRRGADRGWYTVYSDQVSVSRCEPTLCSVRTIAALIEAEFNLRLRPGSFRGEWAVDFGTELPRSSLTRPSPSAASRSLRFGTCKGGV
jgi:hypothetical protein